MKKYIFAIVCLLSSMTGFAQDALTIENSGIKAGEKGTLKVILTNTEKTYINCQFDFTLPAGLDVQRTSSGKINSNKTCTLTDRTFDEDEAVEFKFTLTEPSEGLFRVTMYNDSNEPFMGKSGDAIMTLTVTASSEFAGGAGKVSAIVVTDVDRNSIDMSDAVFTVSNTTGIKEVDAEGAAKGTFKVVDKNGNLIIKTATGKEFNAIGGRAK